jgi:hypothetical protein
MGLSERTEKETQKKFFKVTIVPALLCGRKLCVLKQKDKITFWQKK